MRYARVTTRRCFVLAALLESLLLATLADAATDAVSKALQSGDYAAAANLLKPMAAKGDANAQYRLGVLHLERRGSIKDVDQAFNYFREAANRGHAKAQHRLGMMYETGQGVAQDYGEALRWYRLSADRNDSWAQFRLGRIYESEWAGKGDLQNALLWYRRAAANGNSAAIRAAEELTRVGHTQRSQRSDVTLAIARAAQPVIPNVDVLDQQAWAAQQRFASTNRASVQAFAGALQAAFTAEDALSRARDKAWLATPFSSAMPVVIVDPLTLAFLDLNIDVRRSVGPSNHTIVPGLSASPSCAGDFVSDRLIYAYGRSLIGRMTTNPNAPQMEPVLDAIGRQIACLSPTQVADLESALSGGFERVAGRMKSAGQGPAIAAFARMVAPVQVLILDARKQRGEWSSALQWFETYGAVVSDEANRAGWATNRTLFLWDRGRGALAGFAMCSSSSNPSACIDPTDFSESIVDPMAVGAGDCALAAMIKRGPVTLGGKRRFICPSLQCRNPGGTIEVSDLNALRDKLAQRFPDTDPTALIPPASNLNQSFCRDPGDASLQGGAPVDKCADAIAASAPQNPWDTYAACIVQSVGGPPEVFDALPGVPLGNIQCRLPTQEAGKDCRSCDDFPDEVIKATPKSTGEGIDITVDKKSKPKERMSIDARDNIDPTTGDAKPTVDITITTDHSIAHHPTKAQGQRLLVAVLDLIARGELPATGRRTRAIINEILTDGNLGRTDVGGAALILESLVAKGRLPANRYQTANDVIQEILNSPTLSKVKGCIDETCVDACTALGQQLAQQDACQQGLLEAFNQAMGRQPRSNLIPPRSYQSLTDPEQVQFPIAPDIEACVSGDTGPAPQLSDACGVAMCTDQHLATMDGGGQCRCGNPYMLFIPTSSLCKYADWGSDQAVTSDCGTVGRDPTPGVPGSGGPSPPTR